MQNNYMGYGVFIDGEYHEFPTFEAASDFFDSSVALGIVTEGKVVGWLDIDDCETLYDHTEVLNAGQD